MEKLTQQLVRITLPSGQVVYAPKHTTPADIIKYYFSSTQPQKHIPPSSKAPGKKHQAPGR